MTAKCSKVSLICSVLCLHSRELGLEVEGSLEVTFLCSLVFQGGIFLSQAVLLGVDFALKAWKRLFNFTLHVFLWLYRAAGIVGRGSELSELQLLGRRLRLLMLGMCVASHVLSVGWVFKCHTAGGGFCCCFWELDFWRESILPEETVLSTWFHFCRAPMQD